MNLHNSLIPRIILRNVFGWRDGTVGVAGAPGAGVGQVLVGGEDGGPAVEAHHGRDEVHGEAHQAVDCGQLEQGDHDHDATGPGEDDVEHGEDEEGDHEAPHPGAHADHEEEREQGGDPDIDRAHEDDGGEPLPDRGHDATHILLGPVVHFQRI